MSANYYVGGSGHLSRQLKRTVGRYAVTAASTIPSYWMGIPLAILALFIFSLFVGALSCVIRPGTTYERFDTTLATQRTQIDVLKQVKAAAKMLQTDEVLLDQAADVTCSVYRQISSALIKNASAPTSDDGHDMSKPLTPDEEAWYKKRGEAQFDMVKRIHIAKNDNQPLLECFAEEAATKAEADLKAAVMELEAQMNASKMKLKARGVETTLRFTTPYVNDIVKAFSEGFYGEPGSADSTATKLNTPSGDELVQKGMALVNEATQLHNRIQELPRVAKLQREALAAVNAKKDALGEKSSSEDGARFKEEGKDPKYKE